MDNSVEKVSENPVRRRNYRPAVFVVALVLIAGIVAFVFALNHRGDTGTDTTNTDTTASTEQQNEPTEEKTPEQETKESEETKAETPEEELVEGKTPVNLDQGTQNDADVLTGVVNYAASDGETVMIRVSIDQYLETGECALELSTAYDSFSLTDAVTPSASTSTCSFDIATNLLTGGTYDINIKVTSGNKTGTIKGEVEV